MQPLFSRVIKVKQHTLFVNSFVSAHSVRLLGQAIDQFPKMLKVSWSIHAARYIAVIGREAMRIKEAKEYTSLSGPRNDPNGKALLLTA